MPEAQALIAIVLDPQKGCQPHGVDNLFMYAPLLSDGAAGCPHPARTRRRPRTPANQYI